MLSMQQLTGLAGLQSSHRSWIRLEGAAAYEETLSHAAASPALFSQFRGAGEGSPTTLLKPFTAATTSLTLSHFKVN